MLGGRGMWIGCVETRKPCDEFQIHKGPVM